MTACPFCKAENPETVIRCKCGYGLRPREFKQRPPAYLGEKLPDAEPAAEKLGRLFRCSKCRSYGASSKDIATTGTGLSVLFDVQHNRFTVVSCVFCGFAEIYDVDIVQGKSMTTAFFDLLF